MIKLIHFDVSNNQLLILPSLANLVNLKYLNLNNNNLK